MFEAQGDVIHFSVVDDAFPEFEAIGFCGGIGHSADRHAGECDDF